MREQSFVLIQGGLACQLWGGGEESIIDILQFT